MITRAHIPRLIACRFHPRYTFSGFESLPVNSCDRMVQIDIIRDGPRAWNDREYNVMHSIEAAKGGIPGAAYVHATTEFFPQHLDDNYECLVSEPVRESVSTVRYDWWNLKCDCCVGNPLPKAFAKRIALQTIIGLHFLHEAASYAEVSAKPKSSVRLRFADLHMGHLMFWDRFEPEAMTNTLTRLRVFGVEGLKKGLPQY